MEPSEICGPFRGVGTLTVEDTTTFYSGVVEDLIAGWDALPGKNFLYFVGTLQAMLPATAILLLATYLQYTIGIARGAYNDRIKSELKRVAEEKRRLTAEFDRAMGRVSSTVL